MATATLVERQAHEEAEAERKHWHYSKSQGISRRHVAAVKAQERLVRAMNAKPVATDLDDVSAALTARTKALTALEETLRGLPRGAPRRNAVLACLDAEMTRADIARAFGVSRQRVGQILADNDSIPL